MHALSAVPGELRELMPQASFAKGRSIVVLLPCFNEEATVAEVVRRFRSALPGARVYVYDNNSTDRTAELAAGAGAVVRRESRQGKGHVVRRMLADVDADIYVLADGDLTYDPAAAGGLIDHLVGHNLDMVVGTRVGENGSFPVGHRFGNVFFNKVVRELFGAGFTDILSGYRVMSRRFAKSFPASSRGFEIETELSVHALDLKLATAEIPAPYGVRPENSASKLKTVRDGIRILASIVRMYSALQPLRFYGAVAAALGLAALGLALPLLPTYLQTGLVPRFPTAILAGGVAQLAFMSLTCGIIVEAISEGRREVKRMRYLDLQAPDRP